MMRRIKAIAKVFLWVIWGKDAICCKLYSLRDRNPHHPNHAIAPFHRTASIPGEMVYLRKEGGARWETITFDSGVGATRTASINN
ncbi:hypothetical protein [Coleofasciculus sp.]|uniref:hypothetical protein n=1 Tax=Coleofasciculus sp. TaxID=3100458 RepID=UPI0039F992E2